MYNHYLFLQEHDPSDDFVVWEGAGSVWRHWGGPSQSSGPESPWRVSNVVIVYIAIHVSTFHVDTCTNNKC